MNAASVQCSAVSAPRLFVVKSGAHAEASPRHDSQSNNRNDTGVLNDKQATALGTNVSADVAAFDQFLKANIFDVILRLSAGIHKPAAGIDTRTHNAPRSPHQRQRLVAYIGSYYSHTRIVLTDARGFVARTHSVREHIATCSSDADLSASITLPPRHASAFNAPAKQMSARSSKSPINPGISFPLRRHSFALPLRMTQHVGSRTQNVPAPHTLPHARGVARNSISKPVTA